MNERQHYSTLPCAKCSWHHRLDDFVNPDLVETVVDGGFMVKVPAGSVGYVLEWSQYGSDLIVRVEFPDLKDSWGHRVRETYRPCELEHRGISEVD